MRLDSFGWTSWWESAFVHYRAGGMQPGRIVVAHRRLFAVALEDGDREAEPSGKLRRAAEAGGDWPVTGDWAALSAEGRRVEAVLPRRTAFVRKEAGEVTRPQALAANMDVAFLVTGLDDNFNLRRIERSLVLAAESGARPVVVLNKSDLCDDLESRIRQVERLAPQTPVVGLSAIEGSGLGALAAQVQPGETAVLLGSSGVGKSTIVNRLLGFEAQRTQPVRGSDSRGRHTTTHRELIPLELGWLLIDVPGIRELQLWSQSDGDGMESAFPEIAEKGESCRFRDCRHQGEPGCRVTEAVERGELDPARLANYLKMRREMEYLERRQDKRAAAEYTKEIRRLHREMRRSYRPR